MSQSQAAPGSAPESRTRWHESIALFYYLLAISATIAGAITWLSGHAGEILLWARVTTQALDAGPFGDLIRQGKLVATFVVSLGLVFGGLMAIKAGWSLVKRADRSLNSVFLASEQGFHVADAFSGVFAPLVDTVARARLSSSESGGKVDALDLFLNQQKLPLVLLLNQMALFFTEYTGHPCCASLKFFQVKNGKRTNFIYTPVRDDRPPSRKRQIVDERYPLYDYRENTAFDVIINDPAKRWFVENDLLRLARQGGYRNGRKGWQDDYTATLVVPITDQYDASSIDRQHVIGFLCIDNKGGGFDERFCASVFFAFARITCGILETLSPSGEK